jgi:hypothetical protein
VTVSAIPRRVRIGADRGHEDPDVVNLGRRAYDFDHDRGRGHVSLRAKGRMVAPVMMLIACALAAGVVASAKAAVGPGSPDQTLQPAIPAPGPVIPGIAGAPSQANTPDLAVLAAALAASKAADAFASLAKGSATSGEVPRQSDSAAATLLNTVFNVDMLKAKENLGRVDVPSVLVWLAAVDSVSSIYTLAGTGITDVTQAVSDPKVTAQVDRNTALYAAEVGRSLDAILMLSAALAESVGGGIADISATDAGRSGLDQMRGGIAEAITTTIRTFPVAGIDTGWRQARVTALIAIAPEVAQLLRADQCTALRATADQTGQQLQDPQIRQGLQGFNDALKC